MSAKFQESANLKNEKGLGGNEGKFGKEAFSTGSRGTADSIPPLHPLADVEHTTIYHWPSPRLSPIECGRTCPL